MSKKLNVFFIPTMNGLEKVIRYADVEKELKRLEIIKKSICDLRVNYWEDLDRYTISLNHCARDITKEEYELMKEVEL